MKRRIWILVGGGIALWLLVVLASLAAYPEWRDSAGSLLELLAKAAVGVAGFVGVLVAIAATLGFFKEKPGQVRKAGPGELVKAQLILDGRLEEFDEARQKELVAVLAVLLHVSKEQIKILRVMRGSVIVELEMPGSAFDRLLTLVKSGDASLVKAGIRSVIGPGGNTSAPPQQYMNWPLADTGFIAHSGGHTQPRKTGAETRRDIESYEKQLVIAREAGDWIAQAAMLNNLGASYANLGEREQAIALLREALVIYNEKGSPFADNVRRQLKALDAKP